MGWGLESFGGGLERTESDLEKIREASELERLRETREYLERISRKQNIERAFSRFERAVEYSKTISDYEMVMYDIGIYLRSEILLYDEMERLHELQHSCLTHIDELKRKQKLTHKKTVSLELPHGEVQEFNEFSITQPSGDDDNNEDEPTIVEDSTDEPIVEEPELISELSVEPEVEEIPEDVSTTDEDITDEERFENILHEISGDLDPEQPLVSEEISGDLNPEQPLVSEEIPEDVSQTEGTIDGEEYLNALISEITEDSESIQQSKEETPKSTSEQIKELLDFIDSQLKDTTSVEIVPTKEPKHVTVHRIVARKKKVPRKITIKKITKPGLPGDMLEEESNLTKRR